MWPILVPLSLFIYFGLGRGRLGYRVAWIIAAIVNILLSMAVYFLLANQILLSADILLVVVAALIVSSIGPLVHLILTWYRRE